MADQIHQMVEFAGEEGNVKAYLSRPETSEPRPAVVLIHEIFGLVEHTKDVANRFSAEGYVVLAPHLFSRPSLAEIMTPSNVDANMTFNASLQRDRMADPAYVQEELAKLPAAQQATIQSVRGLMAGGMPKDSLTRDLVHAVDHLKAQSFVQPGKIASLGFCFGGGMSINLACHASLAAAVIFYGENPRPIEKMKDIQGPVLGLYGAEDMRINSHLDELVKAMTEYKKDFEMRIYPGAGHAFFNDTRAAVYRPAAAEDAWERVLRFFQRTLL